MSHSPRAAGLLAGVALLTLVPRPGSPEGGPLEPFELVLEADLVVEGVVADSDRPRTDWLGLLGPRPTFELEVGEVLAGFLPAGTGHVRVEQTLPRRGVRRYAPYERGQRAVFFLRRPRDPAGEVRRGRPWIVLGTEGEGECPVVGDAAGGDQVLFRGHGLRDLPRVSTNAFGHHYEGFRGSLAEFRAMVRGLRERFEWSHPFPVEGLRQKCTDRELESFTVSSGLARAVVRCSEAYAAMRKSP